MTLSPFIVGGWVFAIWFGEKIIEQGLPFASHEFRIFIALWGWVALATIIKAGWSKLLPEEATPTRL